MTPGVVTVELANGEIGLGATIRASVGNGLDHSVFTEDQKSNCTVVVLELKGPVGWEPITGCGIERAPSVIRIGPGEVMDVEIDPNSGHFQTTDSFEPAFGEGTYRLRFSYRMAPGPEAETPQSAFSPEFTIRR
jgi:hypothetical protein